MNIVLLGSFPMITPLYRYMITSNDTIYVAKEARSELDEITGFEKIMAQNETITFGVSKKNLSSKFPEWLQKNAIDLVIVFGCALKIPEKILTIPKYGFVNIHFGKLPQNRGADPVFWSLKKQHKETAITIHDITKEWDAGAVIYEHKIPIILGETYGILHSKMSVLTAEIYPLFIEKIVLSETRREQTQKGANYYNKPENKDLTIHWEQQTADEIEYLINACNPKYGGAICYYQNALIKIMEAAPVATQPLIGKKPGEIVHAHPHEGLFINCKHGKLLKINCISSDAGILSGTKYVQMGVLQGQLFTTLPNQKTKNTAIKTAI